MGYSELQRYHKAFYSKEMNIKDSKNRIDIDYPELEKEFIKVHTDLKKTEKIHTNGMMNLSKEFMKLFMI